MLEIQNSNYITYDTLYDGGRNDSTFKKTITISVALHALWLIVTAVSVITQNVIVPKSTLSIKLGDVSGADASTSAQLQQVKQVQSIIKNIESSMQEVAATNEGNPLDKTEAQKQPPAGISTTVAKKSADEVEANDGEDRKKSRPLPPEVEQQLLTSGIDAGTAAKPEIAFGNPDGLGEEGISRYEQLLSVWVQRHKFFPDSLSGYDTVDVMLRIRIDRKGRLVNSRIENSSGIPAIDDVALKMVADASPMPKVPENYRGSHFEFLLPVTYSAN